MSEDLKNPTGARPGLGKAKPGARSGPKKRMGEISSRESVAFEKPKEEERGPRLVAKTEARRGSPVVR